MEFRFYTKPNVSHNEEELIKLFHYINLVPKWNDKLTKEDLENRKQFPEMYFKLREIEFELHKTK
jgi:hypothetical protein